MSHIACGSRGEGYPLGSQSPWKQISFFSFPTQLHASYETELIAAPSCYENCNFAISHLRIKKLNPIMWDFGVQQDRKWEIFHHRKEGYQIRACPHQDARGPPVGSRLDNCFGPGQRITEMKDNLNFCHCRHSKEWAGCSWTELDKVDKTLCKFKWDYTLIPLIFMHW